MERTSAIERDEKTAQCINDCMDCAAICDETTSYCLKMGGKHAEATHIRLLMDCGKICGTSADFMLRESEFNNGVCGVCAQVCDACAKSCEEFGDDKVMQDCSKVCRTTAESCRQMSGMH